MPLDKLRTYQGRNPRPADFDAYWDRALAEQRGTVPKPELVPGPHTFRGAECFDLWFTGVRGARIHAKYLRPANRTGRCPTILLFHGYSGHSGDWQDKLAWVAQGYCVAALDVRGQGGLSEDVGGIKGTTQVGHIIRGIDDPDPHRLLFRDIYLDTAQMARVVMAFPEVDPARLGAHGASQGGGLTLACASLVPEVRLAAPVYPFLCDYRRVWEMDQAKDAYAELRTWFRSFDPRHQREDAVFTRLGYIDCQHLAPRITAEVMMGVGLMDTICPPSTQYAAYNRITSTKREVIFPDFAHEGLPGFSDMVHQFMAKL
ncbi:MAG: alpha/beta fold hydrolase, partial [Planctomycetota bacterium]